MRQLPLAQRSRWCARPGEAVFGRAADGGHARLHGEGHEHHPDKKTGIGNWSADDVKRAIQDGKRPNGAQLSPKMPYAFSKIFTSADLDAVVAYIRSVPAVSRKVPASVYKGPFGVSVSRNITSHKVKGIGAWSDSQIKRAITKGVRKDGSKLRPPMGYDWYARMTDADLDAIVAYLRTVPPKE